VTANGKPSGTATTNTVIPVIKYRTNRPQYLLLQRSRLEDFEIEKKLKLVGFTFEQILQLKIVKVKQEQLK
jgi:hypothetical protein